MNGLPYYPRYPRDLLEGAAGMPFELKGAYGLVLDLIYMMGDRGLPDDPHFISGHLGCSVRKWNSLREQLVQRGKLTVENGIISNFRADKEKIIQRKLRDNNAENARSRWKNKDLAERPQCHTDTDTDTPKTDVLGEGAQKRARRLPDKWTLPKEWGDWAVSEGWQEAVIREQADRFRDYWHAEGGQRARKVDWRSTWRNWMRRVPKHDKSGGQHHDRPSATEIARRAGERWAARSLDSGQGADASEPLFQPRLIPGGGRGSD